MNDRRESTTPPNFCGRCGMLWSRDVSVVFCTQCGWNSRGCGPAVEIANNRIDPHSPHRVGYPPAPPQPRSMSQYNNSSQQRQSNNQQFYDNRPTSGDAVRKAGVEYPIGDALHCAPVAPWDVSELQTPIRKKFVY